MVRIAIDLSSSWDRSIATGVPNCCLIFLPPLLDPPGLRVRLVDRPFEQPLGARTAAEVWNRQLRWARLRRASFKTFFIPEILTGALFPLAACAVAAGGSGLSPISAVLIAGTAWYAAEALLARASGWHSSVRAPLVWILRDLLLPALWVQAWLGSTFVWRGNHMHVARPQAAG